MSPRTKNNLLTAMDCDALNSATYSRFAARARMDDDWPLAKSFQDAADSARTEHFAREASLESLIENSPENLRRSIATEMSQIRMYSQYAREAADDGDTAVATAFERIVKDKTGRLAGFQKVLESMGIHSNFELVGR